jgi:hypothetical protein
MFELIIENLKPEHNVYFIHQIMSKYGDIESITYIKNETAVVIILSYLCKKLRQIYDSLDVFASISFYYDDESNDSWEISKKQINDDRLLEEISNVRKAKELLEYKLYAKDEKIEELEAMLKQLKDEHNTAMIMLKDMSKLIK